MIHNLYMEINEIYEKILDELKKGHRPRVILSDQQNQEVIDDLSSFKNLKRNLCIICHLRIPSPSFQKNLINLIECNEKGVVELTPFIMEACIRHFIDYQHQFGEPVPPAFFKAMAQFIKRCPKNLLIYPLGVVESLGGKSVYFKKIISDLNWGFQSIFSKEQRQAIQIIERIQSFWPN